MKHLLYSLIAIFIVSCGTPKELIQSSYDAKELYKNNELQAAYNKINRVINYYESKNKYAADSTYAFAGKLALETQQASKAASFLEKAIKLNNKSASTYHDRALAYKAINNLSKEIHALEAYRDSFPLGNEIYEVKKRLFATYIESENWEKATNLWPTICEKKEKDAALLENYIQLQSAIKSNPKTIYTLSTKLLALNPRNTLALNHISKYFYIQADERYNREMNTYNKKKTRRQYAYLVEQLKIATKEYKTSRDYFEQLYKLNPSKETAGYLSNIYSRLNNEKKAEYYRNRAN